MIEAYVIVIWLALSLLAGGIVYEWAEDGQKAAIVFFMWPLKVLPALAACILVLGVLAYIRVNH